MAEKFQDKYRIPSARLKNWDYGSPGLYFITICTNQREYYFGEITTRSPEKKIVNSPEKTQNLASLHFEKTEFGSIAEQYWMGIPAHFPFVELDAFVIMPNHLHGILFLNEPQHDQWQANKFGPQSRNLPSIIRGYKAAVKKYGTLNGLDFGWQPRYYDWVIRSEIELHRIRGYIQGNPAKWHQDKNNSEGILM